MRTGSNGDLGWVIAYRDGVQMNGGTG
jgi:hypothetical protein